MDDVFWIEGDAGEARPGLAIVLRPRGDDWLEDELVRMKRAGVDAIVSLLEEDEAEMLGLAEEPALAAKSGLRFLSFPIPDTHIPPDMTAFRSFVAGLAERARGGERIGFHCRGSIGRATVTAACTLVHLGWEPGKALAAIESVRGCSVPDTEEQREWILRYEAGR